MRSIKNNSSNNRFVYTCNICKRHLADTRYHCTICDDFDLCVTCYQRDGHNHPKDNIRFGDLSTGVAGTGADSAGGDFDGSGENPGGGSSNTSPGDSRRISIHRCIQSLVHSCQCRDANCLLPSCHKMKRVVQHTKGCKRKSNQNQASIPCCPICKILIALCCYHAKHCQVNKCPVPYCINIKHKLKQQQLHKRLQPQQILKRGIAKMGSMSQPSSQPSQQTPQHYFIPFPKLLTSQQHYMKPVTATPPPQTTFQAARAQEVVARQQQQPHKNQLNNQCGKGKTMYHLQRSAKSNPTPPQIHTQPQTVSPAATNQQMLQRHQQRMLRAQQQQQHSVIDGQQMDIDIKEDREDVFTNYKPINSSKAIDYINNLKKYFAEKNVNTFMDSLNNMRREVVNQTLISPNQPKITQYIFK